jgi:hypothetical protein
MSPQIIRFGVALGGHLGSLIAAQLGGSRAGGGLASVTEGDPANDIPGVRERGLPC